MEKSTNGTQSQDEIIQIFSVISQMLDVEIKVGPPVTEGERVEPAFDVNAMVSKFLALLVYSNQNVPVGAFMPPYNRVHADIEYWKQKFEHK